MNRRFFCILTALLLVLPTAASPSSACDHCDPDTGEPYAVYLDGYIEPQPGVPGYSGDFRCSHCKGIVEPGGAIYVEEFYDCMDPPTDKPDPRIDNPPAQYGEGGNPPQTDPDQPPENPDNPVTPQSPDNPDQPENPDNPVTPQTPDNPDNPSDPVTPGQDSPQDPPVNPETPVTPANPETPGQADPPTQPDNPEAPEQPVTPGQVDSGEQGADPVSPEQPVVPAQQETKEQPTEPEKPVQPAAQSEPEQQKQNDEPVQPETPVQPVDAIQTDEPAAPAEPEQPVIPPQQDTPAVPETPAENPADSIVVPGEPDPAASVDAASPAVHQPIRVRGRKMDEPFSKQYPYRRVKMTPEKNIRAKAAGVRIWPVVQTPFQQMLQ